jgi:chromosome segregation ATPase
MILTHEIAKHWDHIESMTSVLGEFKQQTQEKLETLQEGLRSLEKRFVEHQLQTWTTSQQTQLVQQAEHENAKLRKALRAEEAQLAYWKRAIQVASFPAKNQCEYYEALFAAKTDEITRTREALNEARDQRDKVREERNRALNKWIEEKAELDKANSGLVEKVRQLEKTREMLRTGNQNLADEIRSLKAEIGRA